MEFRGEVEERLDGVFKVVFPKYIPAMYHALRKGGTSIEDARTIVEGKCIRYRAMDTIRHHLPDESKDPLKSASGTKGNEVKKEMEERKKERAEKKKEVEKQEREALKKVEEQNELIRTAVKKGVAVDVVVDIPANRHLRNEIGKKMPTREPCLCTALLIGTTVVVTDLQIPEEQESGEPQAIPTRPH